MKIHVYKSPDGWRWQLVASNGRTVAIGEAYDRPQKLVQTLNQYIVRDDEALHKNLCETLVANGLDPKGNRLKKPVADADGMKWVEKNPKK